jgi:hypothetical protein
MLNKEQETKGRKGKRYTSHGKVRRGLTKLPMIDNIIPINHQTKSKVSSLRKKKWCIYIKSPTDTVGEPFSRRLCVGSTSLLSSAQLSGGHSIMVATIIYILFFLHIICEPSLSLFFLVTIYISTASFGSPKYHKISLENPADYIGGSSL